MTFSIVGTNAAATNFTTWPAGTASGDLGLLFAVAYSNAPLTAPTGWVKFPNLELIGGDGEAQCALFTKTATSGLGNTTIGGPSSGVGVGVVVVRGADTVSLLDPGKVTRETGYANTYTFPAVTTGDACTILYIGAQVGNTSTLATTIPGGSIIANAKGSGSGMLIARTVQTQAGTTTSPGSVTYGTGVFNSTAQFVLPIRAAGTPPPRPTITVTAAPRVPYGDTVTATATAVANAPGATLTGYSWTVTGPVAAPAITGGTTSTAAYKPNNAGTPGSAGAAATFTATCTVTDSNGRTQTASATTLVRAVSWYKFGGALQPAARRTMWNNGEIH